VKTKGLIITGVVIAFLSLLIMFIDDIPYIKYDGSYVSLDYVSDLHDKNVATEQRAFDLAVTKQDFEFIENLYKYRVESEKEMISYSEQKLKIAKSIAQLILIISLTTIFFIVERKRKYNKALKQD
jgi:hypothetical protein